MNKPPYNVQRSTALCNPATSDWLKRAIQELENRDPIDAQLDASYLSKLMALRAAAVLERAQHMIAAAT